jgi:DNA repair exonuclease SbcCD ATPase subunit
MEYPMTPPDVDALLGRLDEATRSWCYDAAKPCIYRDTATALRRLTEERDKLSLTITEMAHAYREVATQLADAERRGDKMREALENILRHQLVIGGTMADYSGVVRIARTALADDTTREG